MNAADKQIADILAQHGEDFQANTWVVAGGRTRAILHHCTERMAAKEGIKFDQPVVISAQPDNVVILVTGRNQLGAEAWSFGEAAPKNNKNAYPYSMAEKRAKDRVALKLLKLHGLVYSEAEADEFREAVEPPPPPPRAKPAPVAAPGDQVDAFGLPSLKSLTPPTDGLFRNEGARAYFRKCKEIIQSAEYTEAELRDWWSEEQQKQDRRLHGFTQTQVDLLLSAIKERFAKVVSA
jgi:hypothetical protein